MSQYPSNPNGIELNPLMDGITHINIYSKGKTDLGVACSNFTYAPFTHPQYGQFNSIEAFWYWVSTGRQHDHLRYLHGIGAKVAGKALLKVHVPEFETLIANAVNYRIDQCPPLIDALRNSTLPFTHYYRWDDKVIYPIKHEWIVGVFEHRRLTEQSR